MTFTARQGQPPTPAARQLSPQPTPAAATVTHPTKSLPSDLLIMVCQLLRGYREQQTPNPQSVINNMRIFLVAQKAGSGAGYG